MPPLLVILLTFSITLASFFYSPRPLQLYVTISRYLTFSKGDWVELGPGLGSIFPLRRSDFRNEHSFLLKYEGFKDFLSLRRPDLT
jgi:hypothetical protein